VRVETRVPLSRPYLDERDEEAVLEVLRSGRLSLGPAIDRFEELLAERVRAPYAVAVDEVRPKARFEQQVSGGGRRPCDLLHPRRSVIISARFGRRRRVAPAHARGAEPLLVPEEVELVAL